MSQKYILAYDLGTGGNKAVLYTSEGELLTKTFVSYDTVYPQPGWAEHNPLDWWKSIIESTDALIGKSNINKKDISCIAISGHGMGIVPVDKKGNLLRKTTPIWFDSRAMAQTTQVMDKVGYENWYQITGAGLRAENYAAFKIMWYRDYEKDMFNKTYKFLGTKDFINMKMTGEFLTDYSDASFSGIFNLKRLDYDNEILAATGIPREKMPDLFPSIHVVGELLPEAAEKLNLIKGIPVVLGGHDVPCTAVGAGNVTSGRIYNYIGSSAWISVASEKPLLGKRVKTYNGAHVIPGMYTSQVAIYAAGASYQWLRDNICQEELANAKKTGKDVYYLMDKKASESPPGSNNLIFVPGLMGGGTIHPNPNIRGAFLGLTLSHKKKDLIRSAMEGIAFDLRLALDEFKKMGVKINEIRIVGGGSQSKLWRQIFSDIYNTKIIFTNVGQETAALGAAAIAAVGTGLWKDFTIIDKITEVLDISTPNKVNNAKYERILDVYRFIAQKISEIGEKMALT